MAIFGDKDEKLKINKLSKEYKKYENISKIILDMTNNNFYRGYTINSLLSHNSLGLKDLEDFLIERLR